MPSLTIRRPTWPSAFSRCPSASSPIRPWPAPQSTIAPPAGRDRKFHDSRRDLSVSRMPSTLSSENSG
eukprot:13676560-Alexandrium_andersonii.AAC.1